MNHFKFIQMLQAKAAANSAVQQMLPDFAKGLYNQDTRCCKDHCWSTSSALGNLWACLHLQAPHKTKTDTPLRNVRWLMEGEGWKSRILFWEFGCTCQSKINTVVKALVWKAKGYACRAWKALVLLSRMTPENIQPGRLCMKILPQHFQALADSGRLAGSVSCLNLSSLNCSFFSLMRGLQISFRAAALSMSNRFRNLLKHTVVLS